MSREQWLLVAIAAAVLLLSAVWARGHVAAADRERSAAYQQVAATQREIAELQRLGSARDAVPAAKRPDADLIGGVRQALRRVGVAEDALLGLQHRDDRRLENSQVRVQRVQLRLRGLRPAELGRFLASWRDEQSTWRIAECQLVHDRQADDDRYDVALLLAAPYLALD